MIGALRAIPRARSFGLVLRACLALALPTLAACAGTADVELVPASSQVLHGPAKARGALVWSHGINPAGGSEARLAPTAAFVARFAEDGWDVFRFNRERKAEEPQRTAAALVHYVNQLKRRGYVRVVLAGQSAGGWISLMAAGQSLDVDLVIANAPAYYGTLLDGGNLYFRMNASVLYYHLEHITRGRIIVAYFADDPFDPGGRARATDQILRADGVEHLVIDDPPGLRGHIAGSSIAFAWRYADCLVAIADGAPMPPAGACSRDASPAFQQTVRR